MVFIRGSLRLQQKLSPSSIGLAYELLVLDVLKRYSFQLVHTGRPGDRGKDFLGHWVLPGSRRVQVVGQCKCHSVPLRPSDVRELEGVLQRRGPLTVGILVSQSGFSLNAKQTFQSCKLAMILCHIVGKVAQHQRFQVQDTTQDMSSPQNIEECNNLTDSSSHGLDKQSLKTSLKQEITRGHIVEFIMNVPAQKLLPNISIVWHHRTNARNRREVFLLYRDGQLSYNIGDVRKRDAVSDSPIAWSEYSDKQ